MKVGDQTASTERLALKMKLGDPTASTERRALKMKFGDPRGSINCAARTRITLYKPYYVKYLEREGLAPKKEEEGHDAEHGHGEHSGAPKELEGEGSTPAAQKAHVENGTGATSYGDPRLKDLDGVELCVTDDTPRSTLTEDGDAQDRRANAAKPFRDNSDTIAVGILPRICGCIAADEPMHPNDRARNLR